MIRMTSEAIAENSALIGLCPEAVEDVLAFLPSAGELLAQYDLLKTNPNAFFAENGSHPASCKRYLALYAAFAWMAREEYERLGISETVYTDTMHDIARWEQEHFSRRGEHGLSEVKWLGLHVRLKLFALGELQFEPLTKTTCEIPADLQGLPVFNVHIPKGANLADRASSYRQLLQFWNLKEAVAVCHSWLLSPALKAWLREDSRILAFQSEFTIIRLDEASRQAEERIFGRISDDYATYPAHSSLQKQAKEALLCGKSIPAAYGFRLVR